MGTIVTSAPLSRNIFAIAEPPWPMPPMKMNRDGLSACVWWAHPSLPGRFPHLRDHPPICVVVAKR
jgi:hypothetical protein